MCKVVQPEPTQIPDARPKKLVPTLLRASSGVAGPRRCARACLAVLFAVALCTPAAHADKSGKPRKTKPAVELVAKGKVLHGGAPAEGAVVYLENPQSLAIKSYLTEANGQFHFSNISPQTDYEVWAEQNGVESKHKFISQFSSHSQFVFTLKLDPKKKKLLGIL